MARRRRRWEQLEREPDRPAKQQLAELDTAKRASVLEELQRTSGNAALQRVVAEAQLQRDVATQTQPAPPSKRPAVEEDWALSLDGSVVGPVRSVGGGAVRSEVVLAAPGPGGVRRKHVAGLEYEPFVLEVGLGMSKGFFDWISGALGLKQAHKDLVLHQVDRATGQESAQLELKQALVTAVEVPQLGAGDTGPAWLRVTIAPEMVRRSAGSGGKLDTKRASDPLRPSTVRFEVSGIGPVSELESVAPWTFKQATKGLELRGRVYELEPAAGDFGSLVVTLAEGAKGAGSGIARFDAWVDEFLVKGNSGEENERTAVLVVSSRDGRKLELRFSGVGIYSADQLARSGRRRYSLYVEGAALKIL